MRGLSFCLGDERPCDYVFHESVFGRCITQMKVGVIGININTFELNYGAVLHAWAFCKVLNQLKERCNIEAFEIIDYVPVHTRGKNIKFPMLYFIKKMKLRSIVLNIFCIHDYAKRYDAFQRFYKENLKISTKKFSEDIETSFLNYDCIIVESDVVWSRFAGRFNKVFFLSCDSMKEMKRIAYGVDIGELELDEGSRKEMKELLQSLQYISCRGRAPLSVLQECTEKNIQPVIDSTLLIESEYYDEICYSRIEKKRYILYYYIESNSFMKKSVEKFARENNLKVIELTSRISKNNFYRIKQLNYSYGIEQFISLIKYADYVFTDSFHCLCLSVQYKKEVYAFPRKKEKKVEDLCNILGLKGRYIVNENKAIFGTNLIDYKKVGMKIQEWKAQSMKWLINSITDKS